MSAYLVVGIERRTNEVLPDVALVFGVRHVKLRHIVRAREGQLEVAAVDEGGSGEPRPCSARLHTHLGW